MATLKNRLATIESKLIPKKAPSILICRSNDQEEKLESWRLNHGGRNPDKVIVFRTVAPDGEGGVKYID